MWRLGARARVATFAIFAPWRGGLLRSVQDRIVGDRTMAPTMAASLLRRGGGFPRA